MAIKIPSLQQINNRVVDEVYYFKDLHLDFQKGANFSFALDNRIETNDVRVDYDAEAIKNSLRNIFNTKPGQRFLFPLFGLDLYQFLFEPANESTGEIIGEKIIKVVEEYEPRIYVNRCVVEADAENNTYYITLVVEMPDLKKVFPISATLDLKSQTFIFIETARNK